MEIDASSNLYANIEDIRHHNADIRQEKRTAQHLEEHLKRAKRLAPPECIQVYDDLLHRTDRLIRYFQKMSEVMEIISCELEELSHEVGSALEGGKIRHRIFLDI